LLPESGTAESRNQGFVNRKSIILTTTPRSMLQCNESKKIKEQVFGFGTKKRKNVKN